MLSQDPVVGAGSGINLVLGRRTFAGRVQEVLEIAVKPGWKDRTRFTYGGMGDELPGKPPQARPSTLAP